jgi:hypothetical protein
MVTEMEMVKIKTSNIKLTSNSLNKKKPPGKNQGAFLFI